MGRYDTTAPNRSYNDWDVIEKQISEGGGGGGGTTDYNALNNKPQVNGVTLSGNKSLSELGISFNNYYNKTETDDKLNLKINKSDIVDNVTTDVNTKVLSAKQGKLLQDSKIEYTDIIDNLTSTAANRPLSAKMGKSLQDNKQDKLTAGDGISITDTTIACTLINDLVESGTTTWSSEKIKAQLDALAGKATIKVVDVLPTTMEDNTLYYVGTTSPYHIWLRSQGVTYDMGTTAIDLTDYVKKTDIINNLTSDETQKPLSAAMGKNLEDNKANKNNGVHTGTTNAENIVVSGDLTCDGDTSITNGTVSGELDVPTPTANTHAANKQYVDDKCDGFLKKTDVIDELTETDTDKPLSANMGKKLNDEKVGRTTSSDKVYLSLDETNKKYEFVDKDGNAQAVAYYGVGQVYETLSTTETATTLANKFGGTWEAISDRYENDNDITLTFSFDRGDTGTISTNVWKMNLLPNGDGVVNFNLRFDSIVMSTSAEVKLAKNMKLNSVALQGATLSDITNRCYATVESSNLINAAVVYFAGSGNMWASNYGRGGTINASFGGTILLTDAKTKLSITPDRTYKRFKRTA